MWPRGFYAGALFSDPAGTFDDSVVANSDDRIYQIQMVIVLLASPEAR